jgi:hypothetical protein
MIPIEKDRTDSTAWGAPARLLSDFVPLGLPFRAMLARRASRCWTCIGRHRRGTGSTPASAYVLVVDRLGGLALAGELGAALAQPCPWPGPGGRIDHRSAARHLHCAVAYRNQPCNCVRTACGFRPRGYGRADYRDLRGPGRWPRMPLLTPVWYPCLDMVDAVLRAAGLDRYEARALSVSLPLRSHRSTKRAARKKNCNSSNGSIGTRYRVSKAVYSTKNKVLEIT